MNCVTRKFFRPSKLRNTIGVVNDSILLARLKVACEGVTAWAPPHRPCVISHPFSGMVLNLRYLSPRRTRYDGGKLAHSLCVLSVKPSRVARDLVKKTRQKFARFCRSNHLRFTYAKIWIPLRGSNGFQVSAEQSFAEASRRSRGESLAATAMRGTW